MKFAKMLLAAGALGGAALAAEAAAANVVVVRSAGPSAATYRAGSSLPDNARVTLRPGDMLVVIGSNGTRTLRGPGSFTLTSGGGGGRPAMARRGRFSALRTAGIVPRSPTLWHVDTTQSGKFCLASASNVMLWRPEADQAVTLTVAGAGGTRHNVQWPAGEATLPWPAQVPITAGGEYQLNWTGAPEPTRLTFATLQREPTDLTSVAQALVSENCQNQLDLLIETAPSQDEAGE